MLTMMKLIIEFYHRLRYISETIFGTEVSQLVWRYRHIYKRGWAEGYISSNSFSHPHRQLLVEKMSANAPFTDVLEIGCASGPNLYLLAKKFPNSRFVGIDINPDAIRKGDLFFKQQGIRNVSLFVGKADELERFQNRSFDVAFTDAVLMYIGPDKIKKVATEIQRVARRVIILVEHHSEQESDLGSFKGNLWLRNYTKLFQTFSHQTNTTKILPEIWGGNWGKFGYIIEVKIRARDSEVSTALLNQNRHPSVFS